MRDAMMQGVFKMRVRAKRMGLLAAGVLCLGLAGCYPDPFQNPADWSMTGASREDLAQQVANKDDLLAGRSDPSSQGVAAASAVDVAIGGSAGSGAGLQKPPKEISFSSGTGD
jgi:hypothetical protein